MPAWLSALIAAFPGLVKLGNKFFDYWAARRKAKLEKKQKLEQRELGSAAEKARNTGDTSDLEDIANRK